MVQIQSEAVQYFMYQTMVQTGIQVIYAFFLGKWMEKNGCKLTMILPLLGYLVSDIYLVLLSQSSLVHPSLILLAVLPIGLTGGTLALSISVSTYIARITNLKNRSFRFAMVESSGILGMPLGLLAGAQVCLTPLYFEIMG